MSKKTYTNARLIACVVSDVDWKAVAHHMAALHPASFVRVCEAINPKTLEAAKACAKARDLERETSAHFPNLIAAIKHVRSVCDCGLKEAKDYAEAVRDGKHPEVPGRWYKPA